MKIIVFLVSLFIVFFIITSGFLFYFQSEDKQPLEENIVEELEYSTFQDEVYETCLATPYQSEIIEEQILKLIEEYEKYEISFSFYEIENDYSFSLNEDELYYGASLIKLLEVTYLIHETLNGNISLDETMVYKRRYYLDYSLGLEQYDFGDELTLEELIYYAISVSDNTAHEMLLDYIGIETLIEYAALKGIFLDISDVDHFGDLTSKDGLFILKEAYHILSLNNYYSNFLENAMYNDYYNFLNFDNETFLHKYGYYDEYYHDIGIYNSENPYLISIFTLSGYKNYPKIVSDLSKKIFNIYEINLKEKEAYCFEISQLV